MKKDNILKTINSLYRNIDFRRKIQLLFIILLNIFNGVLEFITLASASLFLESLSSQNSVINKLKWADKFYLNISSNTVLKATIVFILLILISTIIRLFNLWISMKFKVSLLVYLEEKIFKNIINQELEYHLNTSTTNIINDLTKNIDKAGFFIENLLSLITCFILSVSLVISLLNLSYIVTIISVSLIGFLYLIIGIITNKKINLYSKYELNSTKNFLQIIQESLGSIKEIILSRKHNFFINQYKEASFLSRKYQGLSAYVTTFPRYLFEGIGLIVIGLSGYVVFSIKGSNIIPLIGTFALGAQKLLPSMQTIYRSWQLLYFYDKGLKRVLNLLKLNFYKIKSINKSLKFEEQIIIKNLSYKYKNADRYSLENINIVIRKGENLGIIGDTGSGKTTFINIIMGLLKPNKGELLIDKINIFNKDNVDFLYAWRKKINNVPQNIYLTNSTLVSNIALGISKDKIDMNKIKYAIKISCLDDLLKSRKGNYFFLVGENGIKLSGGQKQRVGIARAIYNDLEILVLDESTNALDKKTENKVIKNIYSMQKKITTITISHSKDSLLQCDRIIEFKKGKIIKIFNKEEISKI